MSNYFPEGQQAPAQPQDQSKLQALYSYINAIRDKIQRFIFQRWIGVIILVLVYIIRVIIAKGYFALTYCMGINVLNSFIGFISPLEDPDELGETASFLPQNESEEFRPFQRKVREYQFWEIIFFTFLIGNILTLFEAFDIPVFWPLLLFYFILIFYLTMRKQIAHMIKYNYLPWDSGKANFTPKK